MFEAKGLLSKEGNSLKYTLADGTVIKQFRKAWERNEDNSLDRVMADFVAHPHKEAVAVQPEEETEELVKFKTSKLEVEE
jgi:hypothetical protein